MLWSVYVGGLQKKVMIESLRWGEKLAALKRFLSSFPLTSLSAKVKFFIANHHIPS